MDLKLEIVVIPVADVDRASTFYRKLGFRLDADLTTDRGLRVVQFTPPGSAASIIFGVGLTDATPGSARGLHVIVEDLAEAREELAARGAEITPVWHDRDGVFHWSGERNRLD